MKSAAYLRVRKLATAQPAGPALWARLLGVLNALILLGLLATTGLFVALATSRGIARIPAGPPAWLPRWVQTQVPIEAAGPTAVRDAGLFPVVAANHVSPAPADQLVGRLLGTAVARLPTLRHNVSATLTLLAIALTLMLAGLLVAQARRAMASEAAGQAATTLRRQLHRQMYRLGQSAMPTQGIGPFIGMFTREVTAVRDGLRADFERSWSAPATAAGLLMAALLVSWPLTVTILSLAAIVVLTTRPLDRRARRVGEVAARDVGVQLGLLQEDLGLMRTVRVYGIEAADNRRFDAHLDRHRTSDELRTRLEGHVSPTSALLIGVAVVLAGSLVAYSVLDDRISPAGAAVLILALAALAKPVVDWLSMRRLLRQAGRSAGPLVEFLDRRPELQQTVGAQFLPPMRQRITFENVAIETTADRPLLEGVSFEIPAGSRTALMGRDEEAKHALACMIPRLIDPRVGRVRIDGIDLREATLESIRAQVATVLQSDLVFSDTVVANIGLGEPIIGLPRIIEAAKLAHAHNFIQDLPQGYDTIIGPLGHFLRADEQYRIALARAYLHDPSIIIIEEPAVAMDEDTKHLIDDTIGRLAQDRTLIFLPHRYSTIRSCDQVIVLHNGRLEAAGPPRDLQASSKVYRHLQYVEFNQFATGEIEAGQMNA